MKTFELIITYLILSTAILSSLYFLKYNVIGLLEASKSIDDEIVKENVLYELLSIDTLREIGLVYAKVDIEAKKCELKCYNNSIYFDNFTQISAQNISQCYIRNKRWITIEYEKEFIKIS